MYMRLYIIMCVYVRVSLHKHALTRFVCMRMRVRVCVCVCLFARTRSRTWSPGENSPKRTFGCASMVSVSPFPPPSPPSPYTSLISLRLRSMKATLPMCLLASKRVRTPSITDDAIAAGRGELHGWNSCVFCSVCMCACISVFMCG
jgi:hypothetical protein